MKIVLKYYKNKLKQYKHKNNIHKPIIHVYTVCWNEEKFMPFFLDHYSFADKIVVYDNESTDGTLEILSKNPKVEVVTYSTDNTINDIKYLEIKNNVWKKSRGKADWVIVCDVDELLYPINLQENITGILSQTASTIFKPISFEMVCDVFPTRDKSLLEQCKGRPSSFYNKKILFDPHKIAEINYYPGCHEADPIGDINLGEGQFQLLHYKNMSLQFVIERYHIYKARLSKINIEIGMGNTYQKEDEETKKWFDQLTSDAKEIK